MIKRLLSLGGPVRLYTKDGVVLMEVSRVSLKGGDILMRGKVMGTMSTDAYVHPEDLWGILGLLPLRLAVYLPLLLFRGWLKRKKERVLK